MKISPHAKATVRIDFHRKYYHTRTKGRLVSFESVPEDMEYVPDAEYDLGNVIASAWVQNFFRWLGNKKDIDICKLLYMGFTQQEIADRLGYKNHSGVNKRIKIIREILEVFIEWQRDLEQDSSALPPAKLAAKDAEQDEPIAKPDKPAIKYDVIEFSYTRKNA